MDPIHVQLCVSRTREELYMIHSQGQKVKVTRSRDVVEQNIEYILLSLGSGNTSVL